MYELTTVERDAMAWLLAGDHPHLETMRKQFAECKVSQRYFTGVGFFTTFELENEELRLRPLRNFTLGDVNADIEDLEFGCGFLLFVEAGLIKTLECHLWADDELPRNASFTRFYYTHQPNPPGIEEAETRDMARIARLIG